MNSLPTEEQLQPHITNPLLMRSFNCSPSGMFNNKAVSQSTRGAFVLLKPTLGVVLVFIYVVCVSPANASHRKQRREQADLDGPGRGAEES